MRERQFRPPRIPDGWSWPIGIGVGFVIFLVVYLTEYLTFWAAATVALLILFAIGIGIDLWDAKAYYYKRAYDQMDKCDSLLEMIAGSIKRIESMKAKDVLTSICEKTHKLFHPIDGKVTPDHLGDQFLSTATAFAIALTTVADSAKSFESLEESISLGPEEKQTLAAALEQFKTIDEWLNNADKQLRRGDRVGLDALTNQMKSYRYRSL